MSHRSSAVPWRFTGNGIAVCVAIGLLYGLPVSAAPLIFPTLRCDAAPAATPLVLADLDGDGHVDAISAGSGNATLAVSRGNGDGTFGAPTFFVTGNDPVRFVLVDVNGDGHLDVVTVNQGDNTVSILHGDGAGAFGPKIDYPCGNQPRGVAVGDVNGDGRLDIVTADYLDNAVAVLLRRSDGSYGPRADYACGTNPSDVALGDMNEDGRLDIMVSKGQGVVYAAILLGNGDGTFMPRVNIDTHGPQWDLALADFNADGHLDFVVANYLDGWVTVCLGVGDGTFKPQQHFPTYGNPYFVSVADLDGDGKPDLIANSHENYDIAVLHGNGDGTFGTRSVIATSDRMAVPQAADLNGDGKSDLVITDPDANAISVMLQYGTLVFGNVRYDLAAVGNPTFADLNHDGHSDLVMVETSCTQTCQVGQVTVLLGNGAGSFGNPVRYGIEDPYQNPYTGFGALATADFNEDGYLDAATGNEGVDITVLLGNATGGFGTQVHTVVNQATWDKVAADFNEDGHADLLVVNRIWLGHGDATFSAGATLPFSGFDGFCVAGYLNADVHVDLVRPFRDNDQVGVLLGNGDGTFAAPVLYATGDGPFNATLVDVNRDGHLDILTANQLAGTVSVLLGNGNGTFAPKFDIPALPGADNMIAGDLDGDHVPDLVVVAGRIRVLRGVGDGTFHDDPVIYDIAPAGVPALVLGDLNGDAKRDLMVVSGQLTGGSVIVARNIAPRVVSVDGSAAPQFALRALSNPAHAEARFAVDVPVSVPGRLEIFDLAGRRVAVVWEGILRAGSTNVSWNGRVNRRGRAIPGAYLGRLVMPDRIVSRKFVWLGS